MTPPPDFGPTGRCSPNTPPSAGKAGGGVSDMSRLAQHYDRLANAYDRRWRAYIQQTLERALDVLKLSGRERVLDVGCGTGEFERMAMNRFPQLSITGIDVAPQMIAVARDKLADAPRVSFQVAQAEGLPFDQEEFDVVICANMLHHVREPRWALQECARVLRPSGSCVVVDWCRDFWHCRLMHGWLRLVDRTYVKMLRMAEVRRMAEDLGLRTRKAGRFVAMPLYGMMWCVFEKIVRAPT